MMSCQRKTSDGTHPHCIDSTPGALQVSHEALEKLLVLRTANFHDPPDPSETVLNSSELTVNSRERGRGMRHL